MNEKTTKKIRHIYGWALSACLIVSAGLLIASAVDIYFSASGTGAIFTPQAVSVRFSQIAWFLYFTLAAVVGGGILPFFLPQEPKKLRAATNENAVLARLQARLLLGGEEGQDLRAARKAHSVVKAVGCVLLSLCAIAAAALVAQAKTAWKNENAAALSVGAVSIVALVIAIIFVFADRALVLRQTALCKQLLKEASLRGRALSPSKSETERGAKTRSSDTTVFASRIALFAVGIILTIVGVNNGGAYETFVKAVQICTQCIGLG